MNDDSPLPDPSTRPLSGPATPDNVAADIDTLAEALPRVFLAMHWGIMHVTNDLTALEAQAVTPDDRVVEITAQWTAEGVAVQVRVGPFGDREVEQAFLRTVRQLSAKEE